MRDRTLGAATVIGALLLALPAAADWPMRRHDPGHTATSPDRADLLRPIVTWRYHLGATLNPEQLVTAAIIPDAGGSHALVFIEGNTISAVTHDARPLWTTPIPGATYIDVVADLNGDGVDELAISASSGHVYLLGAQDGRVVWQSPDLGDEAPRGKLGQFDDDPLPELYFDNQRAPSGLFVEFSGAPGAPLRPDRPNDIATWRTHDDPAAPQVDTRDYTGGRGAALVDLDGDGRHEVVAAGDDVAYVYRGSDGLKLRAPDGPADGGHPLTTPVHATPCPFRVRYGAAESAIYDRPGGGQGVLFSNNQEQTGRHLFTLEWTPTEPAADPPRGHLRVVRHWAVPKTDTDIHQRINDALADLDGDGHIEIVTGARVLDADGNRRETVRILGTADDATLGLARWDARCDALDYDRQRLAAIPDAHPTGIWRDALPAADGLPPRPIVLVVRNNDLFGYRLDRTDAPDDAAPPDRQRFDAHELFRLPGHGRVNATDREAEPGASARWRPITLPRADGRTEILLTDGDDLILFAFIDGRLRETARYTPPPTMRITRVFRHGEPTDAVTLVALRSDGRLVLLDRALRPVSVPGLGAAPIPVRNYPAATWIEAPPLAAAFEGEADEIIIRDAAGALLRIDARAATRVEPPVIHWSWDDAHHPTLWDVDDDAMPEIIAWKGDALEARDRDGARTVWRTPVLAANHSAPRAVVPGRAADGWRLHGVDSDRDDGTSTVVAFDAADGRLAWRSPAIPTAQSNLGFVIADDPNGDGVDNILVGFSRDVFAFATGGVQLWQGVDNYPNWIVDVRGIAGDVTHLVAGSGLRAIRTHVAAPGHSPEYVIPGFQNGELGFAVLTCPDGRAVAIGAATGSHDLHRFDVADGDHHHTLHLAAGQSWPDADAVPLEHRGALLGPTSGIAALYADQPAVVVGSTDGHLYAVDPCPEGPPRLIWSLDLGAAVGTPIFADTDGDNLEEIVVATADGMLHGIDTLRTPPPEWIHDLDDPNGAADLDVTHRPHLETLHAAWAPVPGAVAYEYTFLDANGPCGPFMPAQGTRAVSNCPLIPGARYAVAARATGPLGTSPEAISDGIRWLPADPCPDADGDGHCADDDCDDTDPNLPAAADQCTAQGMPDGIDDDCDGVADEGCPCLDLDADGHCPPADCDDADPAIPAPAEQCAPQGMPDGIDDDCDGLIDEGCPCLDGPAPEVPNGADDDCDGAIDEGCVEERANGIDDDCDTLVDEGFTCGPDDTDDDEDGVCALFDCDDRDPTRAPGLEDTCHDGRDQDCDGRPDEGCPCLDTDEDGACDPDDCRPHDPTIHPGADELCNNALDDDCDGRPDEGCRRATPASDGCDCAIGTPADRPAPAALALVLLLALTRPRRRRL